MPVNEVVAKAIFVALPADLMDNQVCSKIIIFSTKHTSFIADSDILEITVSQF